MNESSDRFLSRWSRRKHRSREASAAASAGVTGSEGGARARLDEVPREPGEQRSSPPDEQRLREPDEKRSSEPEKQRSSEPTAPAAGPGGGGERVRSQQSDSVAPAAGLQPSAAERLPLPPIESLTTSSDFRPFMQQGVDALTRNSALKRLFADPHFNVMDGLDVYIGDYNTSEPIPPALLATLKQLHSIGTTEPDDVRPADDAGVGTRTTEAQTVEAKTAEAKATEAKATEAKTAEASPGEVPAAEVRLARSDDAGATVPDVIPAGTREEPNLRESSMPHDKPNPEEPAE